MREKERKIEKEGERERERPAHEPEVFFLSKHSIFSFTLEGGSEIFLGLGQKRQNVAQGWTEFRAKLPQV